MAIKPVSGEIKAQVLNDNFSALDSNLANLSIGPFDTYTSISALQSAYPNGRNGFAVVLESDGKTGYMYTWTGTTWKKGGLAQSMGLADGAVKGDKIADEGIGQNKLSQATVAEKSYISASIPYTKLKNMRFDGIDIYNRSFNESGSISSGGLDFEISDYVRSGYLDVAGMSFVEIRTFSGAGIPDLTGPTIFTYENINQTALTATSAPAVIVLSGYNSQVFKLPSAAKYLRLRLKIPGYFDYDNDQLQILGYTYGGSRDLLSNDKLLNDKNLDAYFVKSSDIKISNNLYNRSLSEVGGLLADGRSNDIIGYTRTNFIPLNDGEDAEGLTFEWLRTNLTSNNGLYTFLYKAGNDVALETCIKISDLPSFQFSQGKIKFTVPSGGYRYLRFIDKNPTTSEAVANAQKLLLVTDDVVSDDVIIKGCNLSDIYVKKVGANSTEEKRHLMQIFPKYTAIGDSLTAGFIDINGTNINSATAVQTKNNWPGYLSLRTGREFKNIAIGGSTAKDWRNTHINTADVETDCYIVRIGVNDRRQSLPVGDISDIKVDFTTNVDSFYGNYDYMLRQMMLYNPKAKVFVFTLPAYEGATSVPYNQAIKDITTLYDNVHCIDLYSLLYEEYTTGFISKNFIGGHLSPIAYNYESVLFESVICEYIYDNYTQFIVAPYA